MKSSVVDESLSSFIPMYCSRRIPYFYNTRKACFVRLRGCLYTQMHLYTPCMFGCPIYSDAPHIFVCPHMFGCPLYIHNTRKACFVRLRGCLYAPYICTPPCMFGHPHMFRCPQMYGGIQRHGSIQTYGASKGMGASIHMGHPNVQGGV